MHSDPHSRRSEPVVSAGHPGLTPETEEGEGNDGLRIEEDGRGRESQVPEQSGSGHTGPYAGRGRGDQGSLFWPTDVDRRTGDDGGGDQHPEPASVQQGGERSLSEVTVFRIPTPQLYKALELGADVGLDPVIQETADETPDYVGMKLQHGHAQFWSVAKDGKFVGSVITELHQKADGLVLVVKYMAGKTFKDWLDVLHNTMTEFAKERGCIAIETHSREALRKPLLALGWSKVAVLYRVPIDG